MPLCPHELESRVEASASVGTNDSSLPTGPLFFQHSKQCHSLAAAVVAGATATGAPDRFSGKLVPANLGRFGPATATHPFPCSLPVVLADSFEGPVPGDYLVTRPAG